MKETLIKLLSSGVLEDELIAMQLLMGKSKKEIKELFESNDRNILMTTEDRRRKYNVYKLSEDIGIFVGYLVFIASDVDRTHHKDLTI